jgi:uncharacterized protein DUF3347
MKNLIIGIAAAAISFIACNSANTTHDTSNDSSASNPQMGKVEPDSAIADQKAQAPVKKIIAAYLHLKNALTKDDSKEAASAGNELTQAFKKIDKSSLGVEQKKVFEDVEADAKEHGEHIGSNGGNIKHQREHFDILSKDMYDLVKGLGPGQTLYQDFCPMYNNKKGATWLSETKEIQNPYLGKEMPTCGDVKEEIK